MKKAVILFSILIAIGSLSFAGKPGGGIHIEVIIGNRAPTPGEAQLMRTEEEKHPNIALAMHDIEKSMRALHDAPNDFGGHKEQAENDLRQAYVSLRKALYFRLYEDVH